MIDVKRVTQHVQAWRLRAKAAIDQGTPMDPATELQASGQVLAELLPEPDSIGTALLKRSMRVDDE